MKIWYRVSTLNFYNYMNVCIAAYTSFVTVKLDKEGKNECPNEAVT